MADDLAKQVRLIKKLEKENRKLRESNTRIKEELLEARARYKATQEWLDELGKGSISLFDELRNLLSSTQAKIDSFEKNSPLSYLDWE